jgi:hypothetical protein
MVTSSGFLFVFPKTIVETSRYDAGKAKIFVIKDEGILYGGKVSFKRPQFS